MRWYIDDVPVFVAVVETQSVTQAAQQLGISKSKVSKTLSRLEEGLGVRLLKRNSRNIHVTSEGETFYRHAIPILEQVSEADNIMAGLTAVPSGRLVAALPVAFAREFVAPRLVEFRERFPGIELELIMASHSVDIIRDQIDVAVVIGALADSELVSRPLYQGNLIWVTTPAYAAKHAIDPESTDPVPHVQICEKRYGIRQFPVHLPGGPGTLDLAHGLIHANDPLVVREFVLNGGGVSCVPDQYCRKYLEDGRLVQVFEQVRFQESASILSAIYPGRRLMSGKIRAFLDFLNEVAETIRADNPGSRVPEVHAGRRPGTGFL
ncbi:MULTISPECIES: LysR family transcriptional regulator [Marinobacter]|uniref:LysR family transcriptional regulator n=1 Tax=Marinobacter TaxID=2742 RepID=UPI000DAC2AA0|nr:MULTISPECIES: LysR family transcriptional regulator [Marinobacter]